VTDARQLQTRRGRRVRATSDQQRDIARLYAEGSLSTSEISNRFGIAESSLYRILHRHGVALRGRSKSSSRQQEPVASTRSPMPATLRRGRRSAAGAATSAPDSRLYRYRIEFEAVRVLEAGDIRDVVRQAEGLGATSITAISRE
jgi:transposase-like protein